MSAIATDLWQRLAAYEIGPRAASLSFADRLARENRWSAEFTRRVIREYKRFCYLAVAAGHEVTPSDAVDQAWHLHLTYSRDYWERFCREVLGVSLHHGPTAGGQAERARYYDQYAATLKAYEDHFGESPPADIWPGAARRFNTDPRAFRVNPADVVIIPRKIGYTMFAVAGILLAGALAWEGVFG
ncbi:glycine-rich domain-containing protein [Parerythrobacter lacustris]|uniref:Glycine-rich domain-containing protein-like n=1 Tax=Parerythrobacter lacustris TaxID=2969984 RepID=A0ABT1XSG6_9SPHN|nr:hypothetical protein [Parerythrobacter lacustris]MCR2834604.1 hypothetical protein [Parerythrobacter lacustris]